MEFQKLDPQTLRAHKGISFVGVTTTAICHDGAGSILMMKRGAKARDENGRWDIVGGGLKAGVPIEENIRRELQEEICTLPKNLTFLGVRDVHRELDDGTKTHWVALDFLAEVDRKKVKIGEPDVIDQIDWFRLDHLPRPLHSQFQKLVDTYRVQIEAALSPSAT